MRVLKGAHAVHKLVYRPRAAEALRDPAKLRVNNRAFQRRCEPISMERPERALVIGAKTRPRLVFAGVGKEVVHREIVEHGQNQGDGLGDKRLQSKQVKEGEE